MFKHLFGKKIIVLFLSMALIGFFIGYDYAVVTSRQSKTEAINSTSNVKKTETTQNITTIDQYTDSEETQVEEEYDDENE